MKCLPGHMCLDLIGSVAGVVMARRHKTYYARRRYTEREPSSQQASHQADFRTVDLAWQSLGPELRNAWRLHGRPRKRYSYGDFMHYNLKRQYAGEPLVLDPALL